MLASLSVPLLVPSGQLPARLTFTFPQPAAHTDTKYSPA